MGRLASLVPWAVICCALVSAGALSARTLQPIAVSGASMRPALEPGDLVLVRRGASIRTRDIVLVRELGRAFVLHRVVGMTVDGQWVTRGDANPIPDFAPVSQSSVVGRVVAVVPVGSVLVRWRAVLGGATLANQSDSTRR